MKILRSQLVVVFSWGFNTPMRLPNDKGLRFLVNGYLHQGAVEVIYNAGADLFEVRTFNDDGSVKDIVEDVYLDCLVYVIDGLVERAENYKERVGQEYNFCRQ